MFGFRREARLTEDGAEASKGKVRVEISRSPKEWNPKTGNAFLDRMIESFPDNSPFSVMIETGGQEDRILEDSGFAIGLGLKKLSGGSQKDQASYIHTDGKRMCMFSLNLSGDIKGSTIQLIGKPKEFDPKDLFVFFDSLSQGMESEISGVINLGKGKKEIEFVSQAFGGSLRQMFG